MEPVTEHRHAELEEVWACDGQIRVIGAIPEAAPAAGRWLLRLIPRERTKPSSLRGRLSYAAWRARMARRPPPGPYEVAIADRRFEAAIPVAEFDLPVPVRSERWDAYLVTDGAELRLGRHHGVPSRARAITFPAQRPAGRARIKVRPFYTDDNNLSIGSRRAR